MGKGDFLYVANGDSGLLILDISDPVHPRRVNNVIFPKKALCVYVLDSIAYVGSDDRDIYIVHLSNLSFHPFGYDEYASIKGFWIEWNRMYVIS